MTEMDDRIEERRDEIDAQLRDEFGKHFWNDGDNRTKREMAMAKSNDDFRSLINDCLVEIKRLRDEIDRLEENIEYLNVALEK